MVGLYWIPIVDICWCICDIPHWALCDDCDLAVFFPRTRERHSQEILLAINNRCNYCRRPGRWLNITILTFLSSPGWQVLNFFYFEIIFIFVICLRKKKSKKKTCHPVAWPRDPGHRTCRAATPLFHFEKPRHKPTPTYSVHHINPATLDYIFLSNLFSNFVSTLSVAFRAE